MGIVEAMIDWICFKFISHLLQISNNPNLNARYLENYCLIVAQPVQMFINCFDSLRLILESLKIVFIDLIKGEWGTLGP